MHVGSFFHFFVSALAETYGGARRAGVRLGARRAAQRLLEGVPQCPPGGGRLSDLSISHGNSLIYTAYTVAMLDGCAAT
jgi:hypothetical protein